MTTESQQEEKARIWAELDEADRKGIPAQSTPQEPATAASETATSPAKGETAAPATVDPLAAATADPYAGVPQIVRDEITGLKSMFQRKLDDANGRIGGLNRELTQMREAAKTTTHAGGDAPSATALKAAQGDASKMAQLKADYPQFAEALESALDEKLQSVQAQLANARPANQVAGITAQDFEKFKRDSFVESKHEGWQDRVKAPAFHGWLASQSREVQLLAASDDPRDAVRLLDLESVARQRPTSQSTQDQTRLDAAAVIPTGRGAQGARVGKPVDQMTKAEYWAHLDQLDAEKARATAP